MFMLTPAWVPFWFIIAVLNFAAMFARVSTSEWLWVAFHAFGGVWAVCRAGSIWRTTEK